MADAPRVQPATPVGFAARCPRWSTADPGSLLSNFWRHIVLKTSEAPKLFVEV
jgi:hypothetical protein